MGENLQTSLFLWVTFVCSYRNKELPSSSYLWEAQQALFSQESPFKARSNTVFTVSEQAEEAGVSVGFLGCLSSDRPVVREIHL